MSMGTVKDYQGELFITPSDLPTGEGHLFYEKLNQLLSKHQFDKQVEDLCRPFMTMAAEEVVRRFRRAFTSA